MTGTAVPTRRASAAGMPPSRQARNEIGRDEQGTATAMAGPHDVDIRGLIASMPERVPFVQYMPEQQAQGPR